MSIPAALIGFVSLFVTLVCVYVFIMTWATRVVANKKFPMSNTLDNTEKEKIESQRNEYCDKLTKDYFKWGSVACA